MSRRRSRYNRYNFGDVDCVREYTGDPAGCGGNANCAWVGNRCQRKPHTDPTKWLNPDRYEGPSLRPTRLPDRFPERPGLPIANLNPNFYPDRPRPRFEAADIQRILAGINIPPAAAAAAAGPAGPAGPGGGPVIHTGPQGGQYYINANGNKVYISGRGRGNGRGRGR